MLYGAGTMLDTLLINGSVDNLYILSNCLYAGFYMLFFYFGFKQDDIFPECYRGETEKEQVAEESAVEERTDMIPSAVRKQLAEGLKTLMEHQKIYRDPMLRLEQVAKRLSTNRTYLSLVIKECYDDNFIGFVNRYRIGEAEQLIGNEANQMNINEVAGYVGFSSISSFNTFFKRYTRQRPTEYRKTARKGRE
jgi:AraC-like DNA-binding protein